MFRYLPIRSVTGREILDSRGNPTVEVEVAVGEGILGLEGSVSHLLWRARRQMRFICRCTSTWAAATQAVCPCR